MSIEGLIQAKLNEQYQTVMDPCLVSFLLKKDYRMAIYLSLVERTAWSQVKKIDVVTGITLLQQSFDLHQLVSNQPDANNTEKILQGDRFSAQYYALLAYHSENKLIEVLAQATKVISQLMIQMTEQKTDDRKTVVKLKYRLDTTVTAYLLRYFNLHQLEAFFHEEPQANQIDSKLIDLARLINARFKLHFQNGMIK